MTERPIKLERADLVVLNNRWDDACSNLNVKSVFEARKASIFGEIVKAYDSRLGYHNLDHLSYMFNVLDDYKDELRRPELVDLAVFFHDFVQNPGSRENEQKSANYAMRALFALGSSGKNAWAVSDLVLASKHHTVRRNAKDDHAFFLDADMAILGAEPESYSRYSLGVAMGYKNIDPKLYLKGRQAFLESWRGRRIFSTPQMHERFHDRAQENITHEISQLKIVASRL